jgi:hypothetical protein
MNCEQVRDELLDLLDGQPDETTSAALREHLEGCAGCRREADEAKETWSLLGRLEENRSSEAMRSRFYEMLESHRSQTGARSPRVGLTEWLESWWPRRPALQAGIALAMLVAGLWLGPRVGLGPGEPAELQELRDEMRSMSRTVTLSLLEHPSASERLRAVSLSQRADQNTDLIQAMIDVINTDPSVNVRLAALDLLSRMMQRTDVRSGLLEAFPRQEEPTMQVALAEVLMAMNGPRSRETIQKTIEGGELPDPIRDYLKKILSEGGKEL